MLSDFKLVGDVGNWYVGKSGDVYGPITKYAKRGFTAKNRISITEDT